MLSKPASECTVGEILRLTEGSLAPITCLEQEVNECPRQSSCITLPMWEGLYKQITNYLDNITLQKMIDDFTSANGGDYMI